MNKKQEIKASLKDVSLKVNNQQILKNINLELRNGKITTLIGPNGGGKTCIARILAGILNPTEGNVFVESSSKIGYMPQKFAIEKTIPLRVIDFLNLGLRKDKNTLEKAIKRLEIEHILEKSIHQISGGELQKTLLARTLSTNPDILILDEPASCMDIGSVAEFYRIIAELKDENNCAILIISHDLHIVMQTTNHVVCVNRHICCEGTPEIIGDHPEYLSLFGKNKIDNIAIYSHHHDHKH